MLLATLNELCPPFGSAVTGAIEDATEVAMRRGVVAVDRYGGWKLTEALTAVAGISGMFSNESGSDNPGVDEAVKVGPTGEYSVAN